MWSNWNAMRALALRWLNRERMDLLVDAFLALLPGALTAEASICTNIDAISAALRSADVSSMSLRSVGVREPILRPLLPSFLRKKDSIVLYANPVDFINEMNFTEFERVVDAYRNDNYMVFSSTNGLKRYVVFKKSSCSSKDELRAYFEAAVSLRRPAMKQKEIVDVVYCLFVEFSETLGWNLNRILVRDRNSRVFAISS
jgi:hypothetical protein